MSTTQESVDPRHHARRFKALLSIIIAGVFVFAAVQPVSAAEPQPVQAQSIATQVTVDRAASGLASLVRNPDLDAVAAAWAAQMATAGVMSHNPSLAAQMPGAWLSAGENVAYGQTDGTLMEAAWMASPGHRANILGDFTDIGIAFVTADGTTWGVQVFAKY